jgi:hypothetical protein
VSGFEHTHEHGVWIRQRSNMLKAAPEGSDDAVGRVQLQLRAAQLSCLRLLTWREDAPVPEAREAPFSDPSANASGRVLGPLHAKS